MAEVKNSFLKSKMNKDLDDRLMPNGEYRDAINVSINKSQGDGSAEGNVGTIQNVLGNEIIADFSSIIPGNLTGLEVIGVLPDDNTNTIFSFLTNNTLKPYVPVGAVGKASSYPSDQDSDDIGVVIIIGGTSYTSSTNVTTTALGGVGTGMKLTTTAIAGIITSVVITDPGNGYVVGDQIQINGGDNNASIQVSSVEGPITITNQGAGYTAPIDGTVSYVSGSGNGKEMTVSAIVSGGQITFLRITNFGGGYEIGDVLSVDGGTTSCEFTIDSLLPSYSAVISLNPNISSSFKIIAEGSWLNFSTQAPITGINIIEQLLFFTDNRNQPRKVNVNRNPGYYTTEDQISVAKYYPYQSIELYRPSQAEANLTTTPVSATTDAINNSSVITLATTSGVLTQTLGVIGTGILPGTFVTEINWPTSITVNQPQTLTAGTAIEFVQAESSMQDAVSEFLPTFADALVGGTPTATSFTIAKASYDGTKNIIGHTIYIENPPETFTSTSGVVSSVVENINSFDITCTATTPVLISGDKVRFAIANPYYDEDFASNSSIDFLSDKFVRFSYRYKLDDGEYSLIAPFTQPCFIPKQDGYFLDRLVGEKSGGDDNDVSDEQNTYKSTEVSFMENKANKIYLNIPLPCKANDLTSEYKITELEILYKESDKTAIKVVETIPVANNIIGNQFNYEYEYGSKSPFKTLPEKETTRVFDKVPVKALSQEVSSNRIIYGNYQDKHTPPEFLDFTLGASPKNDTFFISDNNVDSNTSIVEYPNSTLKQNRDFEVGIVLADRFGRQSTILFSKQSLYSFNPFLASSIYSPYRGPNENTPLGGTKNFDGNSLKIQFNDFIQSNKNDLLGTPGLYNGDALSSSYNPLGWYSFKVVVKQQQQQYYNAYIPSAMACYPILKDREKELEVTSHIILTNDNINKIPRDLTEVGPAQKDFRSSVRLFGRVTSSADGAYDSSGVIAFNTTNEIFYPSKIADIASNVATIKDLFDYEQFDTLVTGTNPGYLFYNFDYIVGTTSSFPDSSSLVARITTQKKFGVQIEASGTYEAQYQGLPALNVYEVEPVVSVLDIYYETSTSGTIEDLNKAIDEGGAPDQFYSIKGGANLMTEGLAAGSYVTEEFRPVRLDGSPIIPVADNTCVFSQDNSIITIDEEGIIIDSNPDGVLFTDIFEIIDNSLDPSITLGSFRIKLKKPAGNDAPGLVYLGPPGSPKNDFIFNLVFGNTNAGTDVLIPLFRDVENIPPALSPAPLGVFQNKTSIDLCRPAVTSGETSFGGVTIPTNYIESDDPVGISRRIATIIGLNGSSTVDLQKIDLNFEIVSIFNLPSYSTGGNDGWVEIPENQINSYFILSTPEQNTSGTSVDRFLIAEDSVEPMIPYQVQIRAYDGAGQSAYCYATFIFRDAPEIVWDGITSIIDFCPTYLLSSTVFSQQINYGQQFIGGNPQTSQDENLYRAVWNGDFASPTNAAKMQVQLDRIAGTYIGQVNIKCRINATNPNTNQSFFQIFDENFNGFGNIPQTVTYDLDNYIFNQGYSSNYRITLEITGDVPEFQTATAKVQIRFCDPS